MATYAEAKHRQEIKARRAAQDQVMAARHASFDADVKQNTDKRGRWKRMKYERPSFIVVTASEAFREGWDRIFTKPEVKEDSNGGPIEGAPAPLR